MTNNANETQNTETVETIGLAPKIGKKCGAYWSHGVNNVDGKISKANGRESGIYMNAFMKAGGIVIDIGNFASGYKVIDKLAYAGMTKEGKTKEGKAVPSVAFFKGQKYMAFANETGWLSVKEKTETPIDANASVDTATVNVMKGIVATAEKVAATLKQ